MARATKRAKPAPRPATRAKRPGVESAAGSPLLRVARDIAALRASDTSARLEAGLQRLAAACGQDGDVPATLFEAWLRRRDGRPDKTRALALAWAREQIRLALQDLLEQEAHRGRIRGDLGADGLAWILLAGCEALAHEPAGAASDRIRLLLALSERHDQAG